MDDAASEREFEFRINAMIEALRRCDQQGIFALNQPRAEIVINVELLPPDETNTLRAKRLNPPEALGQWLIEGQNRQPETVQSYFRLPFWLVEMPQGG